MKEFFKKALKIVITIFLIIMFACQSAYAQGLSPKLSHGWKRHIRSGKFFPFKKQEFSSPTIENGVVYVGSTRGRVYAFKLKNGHTIWKWKGKDRIESSPTVALGRVYVGDNEGYLNCLSTETGDLLWQYQNNAEVISKPVVYGDRVYYTTLGNKVVALDANTGQWIWHYKSPFSERLNVRLNSSPVVEGNWVYVGFTNGYLVALKADDGKEVWSRPLGKRGQLLLGITTPVIVGDLLIAANYGRTLYALNRKTSEVKWVFTGNGISKVATDGSKVYFTTLDGRLLAADLDGGYKIWEEQFDDPPLTAPVVDSGYIALGDKEGRIFIVDAEDGRIMKKKNPWFDISSFTTDPVFNEGYLCFYSDHGKLYCKRAK